MFFTRVVSVPKGIVISIWHLPAEIKIRKENIRTKRDTSKAYSEPCQSKILNGFQLLSIVFIV